MQAAAEHRARSPLLEAGLDKAAVRAIARRLSIPVWDNPRSRACHPGFHTNACYSGNTVQDREGPKISYAAWGYGNSGHVITTSCAEWKLRADMEIAFRQREEIVAGLKEIGYLWVSLDLTALRSGSLNEVLKIKV